MTAGEMYHSFSMLVEFAYTGAADISAADAAPIWAMACSFGFLTLQVRPSVSCPSRITTRRLLCLAALCFSASADIMVAH